MILKPEKLKFETLQSQRTGETFGRHAMISKDLKLESLFASYEVLPPGRNSSSEHRHTRKEEILYVLKGSPTVRVSGKENRASAGDFICFPKDTDFHLVRNDTDEECHFIVMAAGAAEDKTIYF